MQGNADAQDNLGTLYIKGEGVPQDYGKARQCYEPAAAQGNARAQYNLGVLYARGDGAPEDQAKARQWYEQAAAQGHTEAQIALGVLYANGWGVPRDDVQAYMWWSLAAGHSTGNDQKNAAHNRDDVARRMTPAQIAEAQKLVQEWKPKDR